MAVIPVMDLALLFPTEQELNMQQKGHILNLEKNIRMTPLTLNSDGDKAISSIVGDAGKVRANDGLVTVPKLPIPYEH